MKRFLRNILFVLMACVLFVSVGDTLNAKAAQKATSAQKKAGEKALKKKLKKLYSQHIKNCENDLRLLYAYKDIDGDGINELFVVEESNFLYVGYDLRSSLLNVYSYKNKKVKCLTKNNDIVFYDHKSPEGPTNISFYNNCKYIYHYDGTGEDSYNNFWYKLSGNSYKEVLRLFSDEPGTTYYKGKEEISENDYYSYVDKLSSKECKLSWKEYSGNRGNLDDFTGFGNLSSSLLHFFFLYVIL